MNRTILPGTIRGEIAAVASKSHIHRLLICAALSEGETIIRHGALCEDIDATSRCLSALGASVERGAGEIRVRGIGQNRPTCKRTDENTNSKEARPVRSQKNTLTEEARPDCGANSTQAEKARPACGANSTQTEKAQPVCGENNAQPEKALLDCGESGSTYRFLLPIACALGVDSVFALSGRLPQRPIDDLLGQMLAHGASVSGVGTDRVHVSGALSGGEFTLPGNVSSQYITAILFAMPLTGQDCTLTVTGALESAAYVDLTLSVIRSFGVSISREGNIFSCAAGQRYISPGLIRAEGDWSNVAFALCAAAAGMGSARISGLNIDSVQGDKAVLDVIRRFGAKAEMRFSADIRDPLETPSQGDTTCVEGAHKQYGSGCADSGYTAFVEGAPLHACRVDIGPIPDMAPAISLMGAMAQGETVIENAGRLRLKESDRIESTVSMLRSLGARAWCENDEIHIIGTGGVKLPGGAVDSFADHRIAMAASCAAAICTGPVTVTGAQCVAKSYPGFYDDLPMLGLEEENEK